MFFSNYPAQVCNQADQTTRLFRAEIVGTSTEIVAVFIAKVFFTVIFFAVILITIINFIIFVIVAVVIFLFFSLFRWSIKINLDQ